jgi:hypothetical protein
LRSSHAASCAHCIAIFSFQRNSIHKIMNALVPATRVITDTERYFVYALQYCADYLGRFGEQSDVQQAE